MTEIVKKDGQYVIAYDFSDLEIDRCLGLNTEVVVDGDNKLLYVTVLKDARV